jgi:hypothetical protein
VIICVPPTSVPDAPGPVLEPPQCWSVPYGRPNASSPAPWQKKWSGAEGRPLYGQSPGRRAQDSRGPPGRRTRWRRVSTSSQRGRRSVCRGVAVHVAVAGVEVDAVAIGVFMVLSVKACGGRPIRSWKLAVAVSDWSSSDERTGSSEPVVVDRSAGWSRRPYAANPPGRKMQPSPASVPSGPSQPAVQGTVGRELFLRSPDVPGSVPGEASPSVGGR